MTFTIQHLEKLKSEGKIKGYTQPEKQEPCKVVKTKKGNKTKAWIELNLTFWCVSKELTLQKEYKFHETRKWRFDWYIPELKTGLEYEGLMSEKSRHTTKKGYTGDAEKYTQAALLGYRVFRYTALSYKTIIQDLEALLNSDQNVQGSDTTDAEQNYRTPAK